MHFQDLHYKQQRIELKLRVNLNYDNIKILNGITNSKFNFLSLITKLNKI